MGIFLQIMGVIGLIFRFWVTQIRLNEELHVERGHLSRFLTYYFCLALIMDFESGVFTLITVGAGPTMILAFIFFDLPFYWQFKDEPKWKKHQKPWLLLERITLHPPLIIAAIYVYIIGVRDFFTPVPSFPIMAGSLILVIGAYFLFDPRIRAERKNTPAGYIILTGALTESFLILLYISM